VIALAAEAHRRRVVARWTAAVAGGVTTVLVGALDVSDAGAADCGGVTATSGEIDFYHSLRGHSGTEWSLFFTAPHGGTWKGTDKSGSFTTKGSTGSVNMVVKPQIGSSGHGLVHDKGTWNCS